MRWLITGGCGFIGSRLIQRLLAQPSDQVRVVDNLTVGTQQALAVIGPVKRVTPADLHGKEGWGSDIELIVADIQEPAVAVASSRGADAIVHLAANTGVQPSLVDPRYDCNANVIGTFNYLEAARQNSVPCFVFASSSAAIGTATPPIHEEIAPRPVSPYGASKLAGEAYCSAYARSFGVRTVSLRFGNVYGPGSTHKNSVVASFIKSALAGRPLEIYGDGNQSRDFIHIDDLVDAITRSATSAVAGGEAFQISSSSETTINELATLVVNALTAMGRKVPPVMHAHARPGEVKRVFSSVKKANEVLGWHCCTPLDQGIQQTVKWFVDGASRPLPLDS